VFVSKDMGNWEGRSTLYVYIWVMDHGLDLLVCMILSFANGAHHTIVVLLKVQHVSSSRPLTSHVSAGALLSFSRYSK
jgi:hypothetical protein